MRLARLHEACGNARRTLAMLLAARIETGPRRPVFWIAPSWASDRLHGDGMAALIRPEHILFVTPNRTEDLLWTLEEVLRTGEVPLAVADLPDLPTLTAVRRLHLAAETGAAEGSLHPLGLILTAGDGGAPGVESRWHMAAAHPPASDPARSEPRGWRLERRRARTAPPRTWLVEPARHKGFELRPETTAPVA